MMEENWEELYKNNKHHSIWPWSDLISEVKKLSFKIDAALELGCGMGANIPFFLQEGIEYFGVDGSKTAINSNQNRFPKIKDNLKTCDFTKEIPFDRKFQLIFDRASVTHNNATAINSCIEKISQIMPEGGHFIGIDWFSDKHADYQTGGTTEDGTKININSTQFQDTGTVHFFNKKEIFSLFEKNNFTVTKIEEKSIEDALSATPRKRCSFNFIAVKNV